MIPLQFFLLSAIPSLTPTALSEPATPVVAPNWSASLAAATQASYSLTPFDYSYIDVSYLVVDDGSAYGDHRGFGVRGSFDVTDNIRLLASFGDTQSGEDKLRDYSLGFGMHGSYNRWLDMIGNFEWTRREFRGAREGRHKGWIAGVGIRLLPVDAFELDATLLFQNSVEEEVGGQVEGLWHFSDYVGLRLAGLVLGDETRYAAGLRFSL